MDIRVPPDLQSGLQGLLEGTSRNDLGQRSGRISKDYRAFAPSSQSVKQTDDVIAYALSRLPATYAALITIFDEQQSEHEGFAPRTVLDMGAGPGTASWAASAIWPSIETVTMVDHNARFLDVARTLASGSTNPALQAATLEKAEITGFSAEHKYDLVIASYALTELFGVAKAAETLMGLTKGMLVIAEPGRPRDYERLLEIRRQMLQAGATMLAPCPHANDCPLPEGDWCHFSARLPRTRDHMAAKGAVLPFEDEKFAYMAFAAKEADLQVAPYERVLAPPHRNKHAITLKLCTPGGLETRVVESREKSAFKRMTKVGWGDMLGI